MLCEACSSTEATVHLTQVINGEARKLHLCKECARESGIQVDDQMSLTDILFSMASPEDPEPAGPDKSCPHCHMRRSDFKKSSRLGCPQCYASFREDLTSLLAAMHTGVRHVGKAPARAATDTASAAELRALETRLKAAIDAENFEEAAKLRDLIGKARRAAQASAPERER
jgi:protein arginine kinase activator